MVRRAWTGLTRRARAWTVEYVSHGDGSLGAHDGFRRPWTEHRARSTATASAQGLYDLQGLRAPEDFDRLARETISKCEAMARALKAAAPSAAARGTPTTLAATLAATLATLATLAAA